MRSAPLTEGVRHSYDADYHDVTRAASDAVASIGLTVEEVAQVDPDTWRVIAIADASAFSWGELVRVSVQKHQATPIDVWVLTWRRLAMNITAKGDYSPDVFQRMDFALRRRSTPPRPAAAPGARAPTTAVSNRREASAAP